MPDRPDYFRCPLCKSVSCQRVSVKRANGTIYITDFYACTVCTVMFLDPVALTRGYEDRPQSSERKPVPVSPFQTYARINQRKRERE